MATAKNVRKDGTPRANTKSSQVRAILRKARTVDIDKLMARIAKSDIGIPQANLRRYVVNNLAKVQAEAKAAPKRPRSKKAA